jgi:UDPglucose 6-dehydrogenase
MSLGKVSVVGLGKLGAPMAACIASKGLDVIGVDVNVSAVDAIQAGRAPVEEPGLDALVAANRSRFSATTDLESAVLDTQITFIVVPTPSEPHGGFSLRYISAAVEEIGKALRQKSDYHLVVITCTVLPGAIQYSVWPALERASEKVCGQDFGLCYNPQFIALGSVIRDFLNPDLVLIGESDETAGARLSEYSGAIYDNAPSIVRMNLVSAELAKIAVNTFVTTKITFANMLSEMCERLPGADIDAVAAALGMDSRIGHRYLKGGLGYGGPCFPRDNIALGYFARQVGAHALLAESTDATNRTVVERVMELLRSRLRPQSTVAVLGLAYKPATVVVEQSQGLQIAQALAGEGHRVVVYDPLALNASRQMLGDTVTYAASVQEAALNADALVLANPEAEFAALQAKNLKSATNPITVLDCWRILPKPVANDPRLDYIALGRGPAIGSVDDVLAQLWRAEAVRA